MRKCQLKSIELVNFRGLNHKVNFNETETRIYAYNGIGKSSLQEAWQWLISGYTNATSNKNFEIFNSTEKLTHETPITKVIASVSINDIDFTIEKSAEAKFTRKKGTNVYEKASSDVYAHYIDNIETAVSDFNAWLEHNICSPDVIVYCLDGSFFPILAMDDSKKARKVLESIVGEVKDSDLQGDYSKITDLMSKGYTIEQVTEQQKNLRKKYEDSLDEITFKIKSKEDDLARLLQTPFAEIEKDIEEKRHSITSIDNAILGKAEAIKPILGERDRIFELINSKTLRLNECRNTYLNEQNARKSEIKAQISNVEKVNAGIKQRNEQAAMEFGNIERNLQRAKTMLDTLNKEREILVKERDDVKAMVFKDDKCAYCGQELPADILEENRKYFNDNKTKKLEIIVAKGKNIKRQIEDTEKSIAEYQTIIGKGLNLEQFHNADELNAQLSEIEKSFVPFEQTDDYNRLFNEIETLKNSMPATPDNDTTALTNTKKMLIEELEQLNRQLGRKDDCAKIQEEISLLDIDRRECANKLSETEGIIQLIKDYQEEKANYISHKINDRLQVANIVMFRVQKDGQLAPDCVVTNKQGVKYATANGAQKILLNIDIQRMFCEHYNIQMPIFIDECNSFAQSAEPTFNTQCVKLYPSEDRILRIE